MIQVKFRNFDKSDFADETARIRIETLIAKFPDLAKSKISVTLSMENSPLQAGPDLFKVKLFISQGRYNGLKMERSHLSLYIALAELSDDMLEMLNRHGDRDRIKKIKQARDFSMRLEKPT